MGYGFTIDRNPADTFKLSLTIQHPAAKEHTEPSLTTKTFDLSLNPSHAPFELPEPLPAILSLMQYPTTDDTSSISILNPTRRTILVASHLYVTLIFRRRRIAQYTPSLPAEPRNSCQRHAARYRTSQLSILASNLRSLGSFLHFLQRNTCFVSLHDVLTSSPPDLDAEFRAAVHASLRTRQATKIRKRGYEDAVFAIWICSVWIACDGWSTTRAKVEGESENWRQRRRLLNWCGAVHKAGCGPDTIDAFAEESSLHDDADDVKEEPLEAIAASYMPIVQAAAEHNPRSLYADARWTEAFLMWGLKVWRNRCVSVPVEITSGQRRDSYENGEAEYSENEERVLFLGGFPEKGGLVRS